MSEQQPATDEEAMHLLKDSPTSLALYRAQREKGHSVEAVWRVIQAVRSRSKEYDYKKSK